MATRNSNYNGTLAPSAESDFFQGDPFFDQQDAKPEAPAEVRLWQAVVFQVWLDAFTTGEVIRGARPYEWDTIRAEARRWLLLDFGDVIVHIFGPAERQYYQLEQLWSKAPQVVRIQ